MQSDDGSVLATRGAGGLSDSTARGALYDQHEVNRAPAGHRWGAGHARQGRRPLVDSETGPDRTRASDHQNLYLRTV
jgi:hypothetical protein